MSNGLALGDYRRTPLTPTSPRASASFLIGSIGPVSDSFLGACSSEMVLSIMTLTGGSVSLSSSEEIRLFNLLLSVTATVLMSDSVR